MRPELTCDELLTTTRSVRRGLDLTRDVDLDVVKRCLSVALQAPNGANRQSWRWLVLTDPDLRAEVAAVYRRAFDDRNGPPPPSPPAPGDRPARMAADARELAAKLHRVPVLVIPCLELDTSELPAGSQASLWSSLLPAAWSYALAARTYGLVTAWTTVHLDREKEVARLLGLPPTVHQGALLPTAYGTRTRFRPGPRRPLEEVLHVDGWRGGTGVHHRTDRVGDRAHGRVRDEIPEEGRV
ncbi:nitroreductase family protein [Sphaerisporangium aureirubrum]|uniref:Nitroreductase family protein n=1 Tax=Sphaerisporangium aureirubrum TaxID=1544736 RepID=A0ABW1NJT7_9ACTN